MKRARQRQRLVAGGLGEQQVATRQGQTVVITNDGTAHHLNREREVGNHLTHDGDLLEILVAEVGPARSSYRKELGHDTRHAVEVPGATRTLEYLADPAHAHGRRRGTWVLGPHLLERRLDQTVDPVLLR